MSADSTVTVLRSPSRFSLRLADTVVSDDCLDVGSTANNGLAHSRQNLAVGGFSLPHDEHRRANADAHSTQNFALSGFSVPHFEQRTRSALPPVKRRRMVEMLFDALV